MNQWWARWRKVRLFAGIVWRKPDTAIPPLTVPKAWKIAGIIWDREIHPGREHRETPK